MCLIPADVTDVHLNEAVRLPCVKTSNVATVTWNSSRVLSKKLFFQTDDGSLTFFASADTLGMYVCEVEEDGYTNIVSYDVRAPAAPRSLQPPSARTPPANRDLKEVDLKEVVPRGRPTGGREDGRTPTEEPKQKNCQTLSVSSPPTDTVLKEALDGVKTYHRELVIVSLLLAATCVCVLMFAALHMWRRRTASAKTTCLFVSSKHGQVSRSMEDCPSLGGAEDGPSLCDTEEGPSPGDSQQLRVVA